MPKYHVRVGYPDSERVDEFIVTAENEQQAGEKAVGQSQLRVLSVREVEKPLVAAAEASQDVPFYMRLLLAGYVFQIIGGIFFLVAFIQFFNMGRLSNLWQSMYGIQALSHALNGVIFMTIGFALLAFRDLVINSRKIR